jgi:hypothetical protein
VARVAAVLSVLPPCPQLLPSSLQHFTTLREVVCNAAASGVAFSHRLLRQPTAHNAKHHNDCSQMIAAFVLTTVTQPAAVLRHATRSGFVTLQPAALHLAIAYYGSRLLTTPHPRPITANQSCIRAHNSYPSSCCTPQRQAQWYGALQPAALRQPVVVRCGNRQRDMPHNRTSTDSVLQMCQPTATHPHAASRLAERSATCRAAPVVYEAPQPETASVVVPLESDMTAAHSVLKSCTQTYPSQRRRCLWRRRWW